jgi:hypothetical protein
MTRDRNAPDESVRKALRGLYEPPADPAYWDGLEARIMSRVRASAPGVAGAVDDLWLVLGGWSRVGLVAAAVGALVAGLALVQTRTAERRVAYEAVLEEPVSLPVIAAERATGVPAREATLHYLLTH